MGFFLLLQSGCHCPSVTCAVLPPGYIVGVVGIYNIIYTAMYPVIFLLKTLTFSFQYTESLFILHSRTQIFRRYYTYLDMKHKCRQTFFCWLAVFTNNNYNLVECNYCQIPWIIKKQITKLPKTETAEFYTNDKRF